MPNDSTKESHILIIGGGITGLAAAYYTQKAIEEDTLSARYTLLESSTRLGGKVLTEEVDSDESQPFVVEAGPDCFITQKPWAVDLALELNMEERLQGTNDEQRKVYVLNKGRPTELPDGVLLIVPTKFTPFALSPLISPLGKLRMGMDLFISAKTDDEDETLAEFITRRLGHEALDKIAEPLMSGIYNAEADKQSVMATFPRFRAIEKKHGSLIRGMIAARNARAKAPKPTTSTANGRPKTVFATLQDGTAELTSAITDTLTGTILTGASATRIQTTDDGRYTVDVSTADGDKTIVADRIVVTTPAYVASDLIADIAPAAAETLASIRYVSTGTITMAYREDDLAEVIDGFGLVIPLSAERPINAITFSSTKFDNRAPKGYRLLRVFFGGSRSPESMDLSDDEILSTVREQLNEILGLTAEPLFHRIYRWHRGNPQYDIGHLERIEAIEQALPQHVYVTGSAFRGVGMPDCIHQAQLTVEKLLVDLPTEQPKQSETVSTTA